MGARTCILGVIQERSFIGEAVFLEDLFLGLDRSRFDVRFATLVATDGEPNALHTGRVVPSAFVRPAGREHAHRNVNVELPRGGAFDEQDVSHVVFSNWQWDLFHEPMTIERLVDLTTALDASLAVTDANNHARHAPSIQDDFFRDVDRVLTQQAFNSRMQPVPGTESYRLSDIDAIRRLAPHDPARLAFLPAKTRPRICIAVSWWATHHCRVPGQGIFYKLYLRIHARFGDRVELLIMGRHAGEASVFPGRVVPVPLDLGFSEASEVFASTDLLIAFNVSSQAAARAWQMGTRVLFVTEHRFDLDENGFRDMIDAPQGEPDRGYAIHVLDQLDDVEDTIARLLETSHAPPEDAPTGSERLIAWTS